MVKNKLVLTLWKPDVLSDGLCVCVFKVMNVFLTLGVTILCHFLCDAH